MPLARAQPTHMVHNSVDGHGAHEEADDAQNSDEPRGRIARGQRKGLVVVVMPLRRGHDSFAQRRLLVLHQR
eukprot:scaffold844_cov254-Pinguiococcus_pyrenoidosus.AAC.2